MRLRKRIGTSPTPANASSQTGKNPLLKIILMVGVAICVFLVFMVYSLKTSVRNSEQLTTIKELYFPILERVDANIVRIDKIEERFMQAVMTGEQDELTTAEQQFRQADATFTEMAALYPAQDKEIRSLQAKLVAYFDLGRKTSLALLQKQKVDQAELSRQMNQSLAELRTAVQHFRATSYDQFAHTLEDSRQTASITLYIGIAVGVMNLFFMVVLVYFIRNNIRMMAVIAEQNATLEQRVADRTAELSRKTNDINAMLDNMNLGVLTVVPGGVIHPEYSAYLRVIFGIDDLAQKNLLDTLFRDAVLGVDTRDQLSVALEAVLGEDRMMFDCNSHLLLRDMRLEPADGAPKILQLDWNPITGSNDQVEKLLLIVQDVTALRALEAATAQQQEELDIIAQLIRIAPEKFAGFIHSSRRFVAENRDLITTTPSHDTDVIAALFRNMHTVKGNARTYAFTLITDAAHTAEQEYDRLRKDDGAEWNPARLQQELNTVQAALDRYIDVSEEKLGRKAKAATPTGQDDYRIPKTELATLRQQARNLLANETRREWLELAGQLQRVGLIPLEKIIQDATETVPSLAAELEKPPPKITFKSSDLALAPELAEALQSALMHIIRNALDHGIETPEERRDKGKPVAGTIRLMLDEQTERKCLRIRDDGRGLALHKLYAKGLANGLFSPDSPPDPASVADLIFHSGLSTAERLSQISGRGVGMDAARAFLMEHGADLIIELPETREPLGYTPFELVIHLPESHII